MNDDDDDEPSTLPVPPSSSPPRRSPSPLPPPTSETPYYYDDGDDDGSHHHHHDGHHDSDGDHPAFSDQEEEDGTATTATPDWAMEAAAQELEARLANLRQYSNWRFNTRQYPSSPALESQHALWALRQTASGGLSLVLPETIEEAAEGEHGDFHLHRGKSLSSAIDEIHGLMSRRASRAWTHSATMAAESGRASSTLSRLSPSFLQRQRQSGEEAGREGGGRTSLGPGIGSSTGRGVSFHHDDETGGSEEAKAAAVGGEGRHDSDASDTAAAAVAALHPQQHPQQQQQQQRDSRSLLRASLLSKPPPLWTTWERLAWTLGDYLMSLLVFVTLSITWWRGAWNLLDYYVYPNHRALRVLVLTLSGITVNVLAFLSYPRLRQWSRRISSQRESYVYGGVKRLVLLVRMLASVAHWTGVWDALDGFFCETGNVNGPCSYDYSSLGVITCVGLAGLVAMRQMNGAVWGPLFSVSLDFQCELVLDTSLRFHTDRARRRRSHITSGKVGEGGRGRRGLGWHVLDILATQWVPDVLAILAWYGLYTWLPLRWKGTSWREELGYVGASMGVAVGCYAAQFVLAGWVDAYYPKGSISGSSRGGGGGDGQE